MKPSSCFTRKAAVPSILVTFLVMMAFDFNSNTMSAFCWIIFSFCTKFLPLIYLGVDGGGPQGIVKNVAASRGLQVISGKKF